MQETSKKELFETMPVPKALASMAIPTIISQLINLIYNMVDTFFIGRTGDPNKTAGVTLAFTLFMMTIAFSNLFGVGGGSLMARLIGRGKTEDSKKVSAYSVWGGIIIALAYSALVLAFMDPILTLFGAKDAETLRFAKEYVVPVVVIGDLPIILSAVMSHLLRNVGYSKQASFGLSMGGVLNIVLDPLFMFVIMDEGSEVLGAAIATLLSNVASLIYFIIVMSKVSKTAPVSMSPRAIKGLSKENIRSLYSVGIPSAILTGLFDVANIFLNALMADFGNCQVAAMGIVMKAERLPNAINIGLCQGMLPIVAYNFSSGNRERMNKTINTARVCGLSVAAISIVIFELLAEPVSKLFMSTESGNVEAALATVGFSVIFLRIRCLASPVQFLNYHTSFCMQAMGDGKDTLIHAIFRELVFYIPFMFLLKTFFGENGLAAALVLGEAFGALTAIILYKRWKKKIAQ